VDVFERIERAVDFVEEHLREELTLERIAGEAYFSPYHFHRIFRAVTGDSVGEYVRKRRLAEAADELLGGSRRILDIALDYHFQSQEACTRSFKNAYGLTPKAYRKKGSRLTTLLKKRLDAGRITHLREGVTMEPRIVHKKGLKVVGMQITTTLKSNADNMDITHLWTRFKPRMDEIPNRINPSVAYGICGNPADEESSSCEMTEDTEHAELVCVEVDNFDRMPGDMVGRTLPGRTYAVFTHKGRLFPHHLQQTYDYIYGTWVPRSGYELHGGFDFELYDERFTSIDDPGSEFDIYVPIKVE
jgi:AraC family transcriptional regulator